MFHMLVDKTFYKKEEKKKENWRLKKQNKQYKIDNNKTIPN